MTDIDDLLAEAAHYERQPGFSDVCDLIHNLAAALRVANDRETALWEFVHAHDAVEDLIADFTDDRDAYNAAVTRFDTARQVLATLRAERAGDDHP